MADFIIKTHRPGIFCTNPHFYILNKGLNSGKPLYEACTNCFVIIFSNHEDKESYYWLAYSLWRSKFWHQSVVGSVIPFLRLSEFKSAYSHKSKIMIQEHDDHLKNIKALKLLEQTENHFHKNLAHISELRRVILHRYTHKN